MLFANLTSYTLLLFWKIENIFLTILFQSFCTKGFSATTSKADESSLFALTISGHFWPFVGVFCWDLGNHFLVIFEMFLKETVPSVHSVNLISVVSLTGTVSKISFSPFSESSCNLFDTNLWINSVVSISSSKEIIKWDQITTFSL